ncbi:MAG: PQQ-binding-like beta-propeller repeat protein [Pirellulaceae bacterium]|nr:PQQ-binding-like beta-propeller repeat protein [Pirellulaceae bacterium]
MKALFRRGIVLIWMAVVCSDAWSGEPEVLPAGGLIVRLGCSDAETLVALRTNENVIVHGLDVDPRIVEAARKQIDATDGYGPVSVGHFDGKHLPYADNLVNVIVASDKWQVTSEEITRVLAPGGVAFEVDPETRNLKPETWFRKSWPVDIDEWTHYLHDASGNPVARDQRVGPPRHLQWVSEPRWCRSHELDISVPAVVSTAGRIFSVIDQGPTGVHETPVELEEKRFPDQWALVAQDAFNGIELWRVPIPKWGPRIWERGRNPYLVSTGDEMWSKPPILSRRLVAIGDRVYITMGYRAAVSELDAVTGENLRHFADTETTDEFIISDGVLLARNCAIPDGERPTVRRSPGKPRKGPRQAPGDPRPEFPDATLVAIDLRSGDTLWKEPAGEMIPFSLAASDGKVCFLRVKDELDELTALDLRTGAEQWRTDAPRPRGEYGAMGNSLAIAGDKVVLVASGVNAYALADGNRLWRKEGSIPRSFRGLPDLMIANNAVWAGVLATAGIDVNTGQMLPPVADNSLFTPGHHPRCYRAKGTENYVIWSKRGVEFMDIVAGRNHSANNWVRPVCRFGFIPANGLLYIPPTPCRCHPGVQLTGYNALTAHPPAGFEDRTRGPRLIKGPAYDEIGDRQSEIPNPTDWPMYRKDPARSGCAGTSLPAEISQAWTTKVPGRISQPVFAYGSLFVAARDSCKVHCLDPETGKERWSYIAGGAVDSAPSLAQGRVLFGCADGSVYCLKAADGALVWRFDATPYDKIVLSYGQVQSAWPIHGSVLVREDVVYCSAGYSSFLDGGLYLYGLDVKTGKILHQGRLDGPPGASRDAHDAHNMEGSLNDIFTCVDDTLSMLQNCFDLDLKQLDKPVVTKFGGREAGPFRLMPTGGFLDDSGFDRLYWIRGRSWPGVHFAYAASQQGEIMVFDGTTTYAAKTFRHVFSRSPYYAPGKDGNLIVADDAASEPEVLPDDISLSRAAMINRLLPWRRAAPPRWEVQLPLRTRAMVLAGEHLVLAGWPDKVPESDPYGAFEGRLGGELRVISTKDGTEKASHTLKVPPAFDGLIAADGKLFMSLADGTICCWK